MNRLARLKIKLSEKALPSALTKPTEGGTFPETHLPHELTKLTKAPSVSFVSADPRHVLKFDAISADEPEAVAGAIEERAALSAECVPELYLDGWARLNHQRPLTVTEATWHQALDDGGRFLDAFGELAAAWKWTPGDGKPGGLIWQIDGREVEALGSDFVRFNDGEIFDLENGHA